MKEQTEEEYAERDETSCELDESIHPIKEIGTIEGKIEHYTTTVKNKRDKERNQNRYRITKNITATW